MSPSIGPVVITQGDARSLPLSDASVDLVVTSPPYFGLRSYQDGGVHYEGQVGDEATPAEYLDALTACTAEWMRVLKPGGSIFVVLGDKYSQRTQTRRSSHQPGIFPGKFEEFSETWAERAAKGAVRMPHQNVINPDTGAAVREKSLMLLPQRYAIRACDDLGLILRAEIVWAKPNGLPESVTDRVRRSHEQVFHFVKQPRYFSAVDEVREEHSREWTPGRNGGKAPAELGGTMAGLANSAPNPLGKLPGSVWTIPTSPLKVPAELGVDHFAAYPPELVRRIVLGWSPREVCTACGEGRRPVSEKGALGRPERGNHGAGNEYNRAPHGLTSVDRADWQRGVTYAVTGYACACPDTTAPSTPGVVLDPFGGTGTTAFVAAVNGRAGISVDLSADYCRLARWRTTREVWKASKPE
jgi:DNA modification methylase